MSDIHQTPCIQVSNIQSLRDHTADLFGLVRGLSSRVEENTTFLFGPERNGGGWVRAHETAHREEEVALKETFEIVRAGQQTQQNQLGDLAQKVKELCDRKSGWRRVLEASLPALIAGALAFLGVMVAK